MTAKVSFVSLLVLPRRVFFGFVPQEHSRDLRQGPDAALAGLVRPGLSPRGPGSRRVDRGRNWVTDPHYRS